MRGFFKIWAVHPKTGERILLREQDNMILYQGADLLAKALAGVQYANISHMYVGYKNWVDGSFTKPTVDKEYTIPIASYGTPGTYADFGYLRPSLAYSPSFLNQPDYDSNIVLFTNIITTSNVGEGSSADFRDSDYVGDPSQLFEVALVAALDPSGSSQDVIFSRAQFTPLLYDPNYNLTITWGVQFVA